MYYTQKTPRISYVEIRKNKNILNKIFNYKQLTFDFCGAKIRFFYQTKTKNVKLF